MRAPVAILRPGPSDPLAEAAARAAARSRISVHHRMPEDDRYLEAFRTVREGGLYAAVEGERILGVLMVREAGRDGFDLHPAEWARLYGPLGGPVRLALHRLVEALASGPGIHVSAFWLAPDRRGSGLGGALLARLAAETQGPITLLARPGREEFYRRHGFREGGPARLRVVARLSGLRAMQRPGEAEAGAVRHHGEFPGAAAAGAGARKNERPGAAEAGAGPRKDEKPGAAGAGAAPRQGDGAWTSH